MALKRSSKRRKSKTSSHKRAAYRIFVSHATIDKWVATQVCLRIEETGATTFRDDRDIDGGDDIPDKIKSAIHESREVVVLLTPKSVKQDTLAL